jgi:hypothetical protein
MMFRAAVALAIVHAICLGVVAALFGFLIMFVFF